MSETSGRADVGPEPYQPRHEAPERPSAPSLEVGLLATIAALIHEYSGLSREGQHRETYHGRHRLEDKQPEEAPAPAPPEQKRGLVERMRQAWYAGLVVVTGWFAHPEKGKRRRDIVRTAAIVGGAATVFAAAILNERAPDYGQIPPVAEPVGPPPNTEQFFDVINPYNYQGEPYEWSAAANTAGSAQATPHLLQLIDYARDSGLQVDTWGDPSCGQWGINSVTVGLPGGVEKSYYDTPRKLAIMQWFAGGMAGPPPAV